MNDAAEDAPADERSLQDRYAPHNACFGCGPANQKGLRIKSHVRGDEVMAEWTPEPHHEAFPGMLNGGIIGALLDCHANWTAAWFLMRARGAETPPCTVTADFHVKLLRPTPSDREVLLRTLRAQAWNQTASARVLGISRTSKTPTSPARAMAPAQGSRDSP